MANKFNSLQDLFEHEIQDLYSAETQLIDALPKMAKNASDDELRSGFEMHLEQTKRQRERLERIAEICNFKPKGDSCEAMEGLIEEGEDIMKSKADPAIKDAALIAAGQRVEHYEISAYGTAKNYAQKLGFDEVAQLLDQTLNEEKEADSKLNHLAVDKINDRALRVSNK
jgi:ferritin-like metal-binding protein YciE